MDSGRSSASSRELRNSEIRRGGLYSLEESLIMQIRQSFRCKEEEDPSDNRATELSDRQRDSDNKVINQKAQTSLKTVNSTDNDDKEQERHSKDDLSEKEKFDTDSSDS